MVSSVTTSLGEIGTGIYGSIGDGGQKFASITVAADESAAELVAAVTNAKIRVLALLIHQVTSSTATIQFLSASTALTGVIFSKPASLHLVMPFNPAGWFETAESEALNLATASTVVAGCLVYEEVAGT